MERSKAPCRLEALFCRQCGAWSSRRHRALLQECPRLPRTALGRLALRRIGLGLTPPGVDMVSFAPAPAGASEATQLVVVGLDDESSSDDELEVDQSRAL